MIILQALRIPVGGDASTLNKLPQVGSVQLPSYNTTRRTYICYVYSDLCNMYIGVDMNRTEIIILSKYLEDFAYAFSIYR